MSNRDFPRGLEIPSPCVSVCVMDDRNGFCTGCLRTLDEIATWSVLDNNEKQVVISALALRRAIGT